MRAISCSTPKGRFAAKSDPCLPRTAIVCSASTLPILTIRPRRLYTDANQIDFAALGCERRALFVTVSDLDRSLDPLTNLFVTQAFAGLIRYADAQPDGRLAIPVRFMLDDFANLQMPQIDNVLSIIRSREIWATLLL